MENNLAQIHIKSEQDTVRVIHESYQQRKVHDWNNKNYQLISTQSVIDFVKAKGSIEKSVIFYNNDHVISILDDTIQDRPLDTGKYQYNYSLNIKFWLDIFGNPITQKTILNFLKRRPSGEVENIEKLIATFQNLSFATEISSDSSYEDDNNLGVVFKSKEKEGMAKLPKEIIINAPIFNESDFIQQIPIEISVKLPKSTEEKLSIIFACPTWDLVRQLAVDYEVVKLKENLNGYLLLCGSC